jgi:hypothetical protein
MSTYEMFHSQLRSSADLAGVFESDGEVAYFYLYNTTHPEGHKVLGAIRVLSGNPDFKENEIAICWDKAEKKVGLRIRGQLWAAFDADTRAAYGGNYQVGSKPDIPPAIAAYFRII